MNVSRWVVVFVSSTTALGIVLILFVFLAKQIDSLVFFGGAAFSGSSSLGLFFGGFSCHQHIELILRVSVSIVEVGLLHAQDKHVERNNSVVKWEDLDADRELLLVLVGCAERICLVFEESNDFFLIDEVDTHRENIRVETRRNQFAQAVSQLLFLGLGLPRIQKQHD